LTNAEPPKLEPEKTGGVLGEVDTDHAGQKQSRDTVTRTKREARQIEPRPFKSAQPGLTWPLLTLDGWGTFKNAEQE